METELVIRRTGRVSKNPHSPFDAFVLRFPENIIYRVVMWFFRLTGLWRYPRPRHGDFAKMRRIDKIYWLYKTKYPMTRPTKGSNLEHFFASQPLERELLPGSLEKLAVLTISCVGDLMFHPFLLNSSTTLYRDPEVNSALFSSDITTAHLECPVVEARDGTIQLNSSEAPLLSVTPAEFEVLAGNGERRFSFVSLAHNHTLDFGPEGVQNTVSRVKGANLRYHGVNLSVDDYNIPAILTVRGVRIANVSFTFGTNAKHPPPDNPFIVNVANLNDNPESCDLTRITSLIRKCRSERSDFIILHVHWGMEHEFYPSLDQVLVAHRLAELGVDAIIGHHPHVVQPTELYQTERDARRIVPIYYSLGSLVNTYSAPWLCRSTIAKLTLARTLHADGTQRVYVSRAGNFDVTLRADQSKRALSLVPD